ncbi:MAG: WYL domain-containing protein [Spirochaetales bacterium]|uniref:WYL domain-containing protein n=1 Tax=Candidatus Thalassospirochaeta sargassi TaxID=3119039 RepID=A0AAJ1IFW7_9SPIO|nr:WYL domain-containing protein [Spirochaetales bacterium]
MKKSQLSRIFFIHEQLKAGGYPSSVKLAELWEGVSSKTVRRDIEYLRDMMNAPIEYDASRRGYYYTEPSYDIPSFMLTEGELFSLAIGEVVLADYQNSPFFPQLKQIFDRIKVNLSENINLDSLDIKDMISAVHYPQVKIDPDIFAPVSSAVSSARIIRVQYQVPRYSDTRAMTIEPYKIVAHRGNWYLIGNHIEAEKIKVWAINRIKQINLNEETFKIPADFDLEDYIDTSLGIFISTKRYEVSLKFSSAVAGIIKERKWHDNQKFTDLEDGSLRLTYTTNQLEETLNWAFSWGENVVIEKPEKLVAEAKEKIRRMMELYG